MNCNWLYWYCDRLYRYTDYSTPFVVIQSMQSPTHIECSPVFLSQETGTNAFFSSHAKIKQFFPWSISLARVAVSLVSLQNIFQLITSGVNTDASTWLLLLGLFLYSYILADLGLHGELRKQTSFLVLPYAQLVKIVLQNFTSLFLPATFLLASLHEMHTCARQGQFQIICCQSKSGQTELG